MPLFHVDEPRPKLNPPIQSWREDMSENHEPQLIPPQLHWLTEQNDIYMEMPRYSTEVYWGLMLFLIPVYFLGIIIVDAICFSVNDIFFHVVGGLLSILILIFIIFFLKMYFVVPRDQPVRLNRKRQKIYLFEYNRSRLPWLKWPVSIRSYNWADVHGEIRLSSARYDLGFQLYGSVCEPGTNNVITRFLITKERFSQELLSQTWSYLCMYMKNDSVSVAPLEMGRPDYWRPRKADKWPADMELESTTAPGAECFSAPNQNPVTGPIT